MPVLVVSINWAANLVRVWHFTHRITGTINRHCVLLQQLNIDVVFARGIDPKIFHDIVHAHVRPVNCILEFSPAVRFQRTSVVPLTLRTSESLQVWVGLQASQSVICVGRDHVQHTATFCRRGGELGVCRRSWLFAGTALKAL
jgi:hypothetical protein